MLMQSEATHYGGYENLTLTLTLIEATHYGGCEKHTRIGCVGPTCLWELVYWGGREREIVCVCGE